MPMDERARRSRRRPLLRGTLRLSEPFWASDWLAKRMRTKSLDTLSFLHTADEDFPVWWTAYPMQTPVIVGWRDGPGAHRLRALRTGRRALRWRG